MATMKTTRSAPTREAAVLRQMPQMSATPISSSAHGIVSGDQVHERARKEPVVVDHVGEGGRVGDLRQGRHDEEDAQRDLGPHREPGMGQGLTDRHAGPPVRTAPPRLTQSGKPSR